MKKTLIYLLAAMVTLSLVPSCNDEDEIAPEVVTPDDGGEENPDEEGGSGDGGSESDAPITVKLINASSSTLTFEWAGGNEESDYNVALYTNEACSNLFVSWIITNDLFTANNRTCYRFTFTGMEPGTDYWFKVNERGNSASYSDPFKATTEVFDRTVVEGAGSANVGSVLVAEDFKGLIHGGDLAYYAPAITPSSSGMRYMYEISTGENPTDYCKVVNSSSEFNFFNGTDVVQDVYTVGTGLADWCMGTGTNCSTRPGYVKVGGSKAYSYLCTPQLTAIPEGYEATVKVEFTAMCYSDGQTDYCENVMVAVADVEPENFQVSGWTTASDNQSLLGNIEYVNIFDASGVESKFEDFSTELSGVTNASRIRFSSDTRKDATNDNLTRFLLDNVKVTVTELELAPTIDTPENLMAEFDEETLTINVTWDAAEGASAYTVSYGVQGETATEESVSETSFSFDVTSFGVTYEVKVKATEGTNSSHWTDTVEVEVSADAEPDPETPQVSNIREGLGWVNITVSNNADYDYIVLDNGASSSFVAEQMKSNGDGTYEFSISGLDLETTYSTLSIKAVSKNNPEKVSEAAEISTFDTGNIWQLTRATSPCHLYIEWDDAAANKNWVHPGSTDSEALDRTFWIQLATDANFNNLVYDLATVASSSAGAYVTSNWNGSTGDGTKTGSSPHLYAFTNVAMGKLSPSTDYYFRVRNAADETYQGASLKAANGKSGWSPAVKFTTDAAHVAVDGELLFQGFDDVCWQYDHINNCAGIIPSGSDWAVGKEQTLFVENVGTGKRFEQCGLSDPSSDAQFPYTSNGMLNDGTTDCKGLYKMIDDAIPSMNGWYVSYAIYPLQGSLRINSNSAQNTALVPPPFTNIEANTAVVVSCDAGTAYVAATKSSSIKFLVYDGTTFEIKSQSEVFTQTNDTQIETGEDPNSGTAVFRPFVGLTHHEWETTIDPGDYIVFWGISDGNVTDRMIIDNLSVVKK